MSRDVHRRKPKRMDKLFLDTNYLLDVAFNERPFAEAASKLFSLIARNNAQGIITASTLKDFYFIARKSSSDEIRREWIKLFSDVLTVVPMNLNHVKIASCSDEPDFEDGLMRAVAEAQRCTYIISRDKNAFVNSRVPKMDSVSYLKRVR